MKKFTIDDIRSWGPCYDPNAFLPGDWKGTAVDILKIEDIPFPDRLWCVLRANLVSEKLMRLFAVWCYKQTLNWITNPDPRSVEASNVAERFAYGKASDKELAEASFAASLAAGSAWLAARSAWAVAEAAVELAQRNELIEMILEENKND